MSNPSSTSLVAPGTFEFDGTRALRVDRSMVEKKIRRKALSPSTMNALTEHNQCAGRYAAEKIIPEPYDPFRANSIGSAAHAVLEEFYGLGAPLRTPDVAEALAKAKVAEIEIPNAAQVTPGDLETQKSLLLTDVINAYKGIFDLERPAHVKPYAREMLLDGIEIAGVPVKGYIDRVDHAEDGEGLVIIDYKTGKFKKADSKFGDGYGEQLRVYTLGAQIKTDREVESARLLFTKEGRNRTVGTSAPYLKKTERRFAQAWDMLNTMCDDAEFPLQVSGLCAYCPLVRACPAAQANARVREPKIDAASPEALGFTAPVRTPPAPAHDADDSEQPAVLAAPDDAEEAAAVAKTTWAEEKPFIATVGDRLNPASWGADTIEYTIQYAIRQLVDAGQPVKPSTIRALTSVFADIIGAALAELGGYDEIDWQAGLTKRVRSAMGTIISATAPIPFETDGRPSTAAEWQAWETRVARNIVVTVRTVEEVFDKELSPHGYRLFAADADEPEEEAEPEAPAADEPEPEDEESGGEDADEESEEFADEDEYDDDPEGF